MVLFHDVELPDLGGQVTANPTSPQLAKGPIMSDEEEDDIVLAELPDDELTAQMHDDLYDGLGEEIVEGTNILLERGWSADRVLNDALVEGMRIVGICLLYTSPSPRDQRGSRMPSSA